MPQGSDIELRSVLNCNSMMNHIQQELTNPLESRRVMKIEIKNHFVRDNTYKTVGLKDLIKVLGVNWDKREVEKDTGFPISSIFHLCDGTMALFLVSTLTHSPLGILAKNSL